MINVIEINHPNMTHCNYSAISNDVITLKLKKNEMNDLKIILKKIKNLALFSSF
jgi:hypothetical protein